jgi:hypothetical protein
VTDPEMSLKLSYVNRKIMPRAKITTNLRRPDRHRPIKEKSKGLGICIQKRAGSRERETVSSP